MNATKYGKCCEEDKCIAPSFEFRDEHKFPKCKAHIHILCGLFEVDNDIYFC